MTVTDLDQLAAPRPASMPASITQATAVEQARAVAEVAAAVKVAQEFPRDVSRSIERMRQACSQKALADRAFYSLPRAGGKVEGSTVHLARELAGCWGNIDYGVREMRRDDDAGESEMQAWAWDQETNVRSSRSFVVPHDRMVGKGSAKKRERLTDLGDIANNNNSVAARAVRETIFTVLPIWYLTEAEALAAQTLHGDHSGQTVAQQVADALTAWESRVNVTKAQLETRLGRPTNEWTAQDLAFLRVLGGEIARSEKRLEDEFPTTQPDRAVTPDDVKGKEPVAPPTDEHDPTLDDDWKGDAS